MTTEEMGNKHGDLRVAPGEAMTTESRARYANGIMGAYYCSVRHVRGFTLFSQARTAFTWCLIAMQLPWLLISLATLAAAQSPNVSESLLWGVYRPNLYFGMRPQVPQSLMTGLIWFGTHDLQSIASESPELSSYVPYLYAGRSETRL